MLESPSTCGHVSLLDIIIPQYAHVIFSSTTNKYAQRSKLTFFLNKKGFM
jgi:hypothetical protein